jgi:purine-binding chemotaxis protein CheW
MMQVASFHVGAQEYALDIMQIKEIINPVPITPVPKAPPFIEGIVELRGAVLPVVDLRKRFEVEAGAVTRESKYVIVALEGHIVGLVVDRVRDVTRIDESDVLDAPAMAVGLDARFVSGVIKRDNRIIMMLDVHGILTATERSLLADLGRVES